MSGLVPDDTERAALLTGEPLSDDDVGAEEEEGAAVWDSVLVLVGVSKGLKGLASTSPLMEAAEAVEIAGASLSSLTDWRLIVDKLKSVCAEDFGAVDVSE